MGVVPLLVWEYVFAQLVLHHYQLSALICSLLHVAGLAAAVKVGGDHRRVLLAA